MKKIILTITCLILVVVTVKSQGPNLNVPSFSIPSPNANALGKYGEFPVSLSSGTPDISIPLYEIKTKNLNLPINISYHASGIKVSEMASSVGLGFALNAGGAITTRINDLPDFDLKGFNNLVVPSESDPQEKIEYFIGNITRSDDFSNTLLSRFDAQPDNYFYNFAGLAGEFVLKNKIAVGAPSEFTTIPYSAKKIIYNKLDNWFRILDEGGTQYIFGKSIKTNEKAIEKGSTNSGVVIKTQHFFTTAWYLTEIISADLTDTISFKYITSGSIYLDYQTSALTQRYSHFPIFQPWGSSVKSTSRTNTVTDLISLSEIKFNGGKIDFEYNPSEDMSNVRLNKIRIYQFLGNQYNEIRRFNFQHSYFLSAFNNLASPPTFASGFSSLANFDVRHTKRLKLESITEEGVDNITGLLTVNPPYKFDYFTKGVRNEVPYLSSYAQDLWGHWNNAANDDLLVAHPSPNDPYSVPNTDYGANRVQNFDYAISGTLKSIQYPTKGMTEFLYEAPEYTRTIYTNQPIFDSQSSHLSTLIGTGSSGVEEIFVAKFTGEYDFRFTAYTNCSGSGSNCVANELKVEIIGDLPLLMDFSSWSSVLQNPGAAKSINQKVNLVQGKTYKFRFTNPGNITNTNQQLKYVLDASLHLSIQVGSTTAESSVIVPVGGIRIKNITNKDDFGNTITRKKYSYPGQYFMSGVFNGDYKTVSNKYNFGRKIFILPGSPGISFPQFYLYSNTYSENFTVPLSASSTNSGVAYFKVEESEISDSDQSLGKSVYTFNQAPDYWKGFQSTCLINNSWRRKQLLETKVYKNNATSDVLVKNIKNTYSDLFPELQDTIRYMNATRIGVIGDMGDDSPPKYAENNSSANIQFLEVDQSIVGDDVYWRNQYSYAFNEIVVPRNVLTKVEYTDYDTNGTNPVISSIGYYYDKPDHMLLTKKEKIKSNGEKLIETITYSSDYNLSACNSEDYGLKLKREIRDLKASYEALQDPIYKQWIALVNQPVSLFQSENPGPITSNVDISLVRNLRNQYRGLQNDYTLSVNQKIAAYLAAEQSVSVCKDDQINNSSPPVQAILKMQKKNQITPIETADLVSIAGIDYLLKARKTTYKSYNDRVMPFEELQTELATKLKYADYLSSPDAYLRTNLIYDYYDNYGNLLQYTPQNGMKTSFVWGYNNHFPVAVIKNASYNVVESALGGASTVDLFARSYPTDGQVFSLFTTLRTALPGADVGFYTYKPLAGIGSHTDTKGMTTYYEYDSFQRLKYIKDQNGNIIKSNDYHYKP